MLQSLISRIWESLLRLLLQRISLVLTLMLCAAIAIAISNMSALSSSLIESQAVQNAALNIQSLTQAFDLYSAAAAERAKVVPGITVTHAYLNTKGAIPLPSILRSNLASKLVKKMLKYLYDYTVTIHILGARRQGEQKTHLSATHSTS